MSEQAPFYLFTVFVLTYGTTKLKLTRTELLNDTIIAAAVALIAVPLFGYLSDRIGRRRTYAIGIVCTALRASVRVVRPRSERPRPQSVREELPRRPGQ